MDPGPVGALPPEHNGVRLAGKKNCHFPSLVATGKLIVTITVAPHPGAMFPIESLILSGMVS